MTNNTPWILLSNDVPIDRIAQRSISAPEYQGVCDFEIISCFTKNNNSFLQYRIV